MDPKYHHKCLIETEGNHKHTHTKQSMMWARMQRLEWCSHRLRNAGATRSWNKQGKISPPEFLEEMKPCRLLASRTLREWSPIVWKYQIYKLPSTGHCSWFLQIFVTDHWKTLFFNVSPVVNNPIQFFILHFVIIISRSLIYVFSCNFHVSTLCFKQL